jgi:hypothetical protein
MPVRKELQNLAAGKLIGMFLHVRLLKGGVKAATFPSSGTHLLASTAPPSGNT